jgi:hypothetical protein
LKALGRSFEGKWWERRGMLPNWKNIKGKRNNLKTCSKEESMAAKRKMRIGANLDTV